MAQLKDLIMNGASRFIGDTYANKVQLTSLSIPTSSGGTTYGVGSNGQILCSNGTSVYWWSPGGASGYGVTDSSSASAIGTGTSLPTERDIYYGLPTINNSHTYTSSTTIYAPIGAGTANHFLVSSGGTAAPVWKATANGAMYATATNGTITFGTLPVAQGGTGNTSWTQWGVVYASTTSALTNTTAGTAGYLLQSNATSAPSWIQATNANTASTIVKRDSSGNFSAGTITATLSGNASTASQFASAQSIALTGDITGTASSQAGWSIATTIGASKVTNNMLAGSIANNKLANSSVSIAGNSVSLGGSLSVDTLRTSLGLSNAMHFIGKATVAITDGSTTDPVISGYTVSTDRKAGDVIIDKDNTYEYIWTAAGAWERLGPDGSYKITQSTVDSGAATTNKWASRVQQDTNGNITVTMASLDTSGTWSGTATKATQDGSGNTITSTYAKLASPALTGTPTAPTAAAGTNTTQLATTAFVTSAINDLGFGNTIDLVTSISSTSTDTEIPTAKAVTPSASSANVSVPVVGYYNNGLIYNSSIYFNPSTGDFTATKVYNAVSNDYAEWFEKENMQESFDIGDICVWTGNGVSKSQKENDPTVIGVVSNTYGHIIGGELLDNMEDNNEKFVPIGLKGRIKVKVIGMVKRGDLIVTSNIPGHGKVDNNASQNQIIGKALEENNLDIGKLITILI